jgi:hypothetical protein
MHVYLACFPWDEKGPTRHATPLQVCDLTPDTVAAVFTDNTDNVTTNLEAAIPWFCEQTNLTAAMTNVSWVTA